MGLNIVLVEPEIPHNTGSIARTCALTNTCLHLVKPLGFSVEDKYLKRAGLDYWDLVEIYYYDSFSEILDKYPKNDFYYASTKSKKYYTEFNYKDGSFFVFGKETQGLPSSILKDNWDKAIKYLCARIRPDPLICLTQQALYYLKHTGNWISLF